MSLEQPPIRQTLDYKTPSAVWTIRAVVDTVIGGLALTGGTCVACYSLFVWWLAVTGLRADFVGRAYPATALSVFGLLSVVVGRYWLRRGLAARRAT